VTLGPADEVADGTAERFDRGADREWALPAWNAVLARIPDPHPCLTPEWQRAWWEHFGSGELEVLRLVAHGEVVGVAALRHDRDGSCGSSAAAT